MNTLKRIGSKRGLRDTTLFPEKVDTTKLQKLAPRPRPSLGSLAAIFNRTTSRWRAFSNVEVYYDLFL